MIAQDLVLAALVGVVAGLGAYVVSCAVHVWWKRNRGADASGRAPNAARRLAGWCTCLFLLGLGLIAAVGGWRELVPREGCLDSEGLLAVRMPEGLEVVSVTNDEFVESGAVLARFACPERGSRIRVLELRQAALEAKKHILADEPLELDPELVRRYRQVTADKWQMRVSRDQLAPVRDLLLREKLRQRLDRRERLCALTGEVERTEQELAQEAVRLKCSQSALWRAQRAAESGSATDEELESRQTDAQVLAAGMEKLQAKLKALKAEREELERGLREYEAVASDQTRGLSAEVVAAEKEMGEARDRADALFARLERDAERARRVRHKRIEQLGVEIAQAKAEIAGLLASLVANAPFPGKVVYRDPSPRTAGSKAPLVVLAGRDALRLRLRMPRAEANALAEEARVVLELLHPEVQRRFTGRLIRTEALPADPGYVVAEVACRPPQRTVRSLVDDTVVSARLAWRPWLGVYPLFWVGAVLASLGAVGRAGLGWRARRIGARGVVNVALKERAEGNSPAADGAARPAFELRAELTARERGGHKWSGAPTPMGEQRYSADLMRTLGEQLRAMIAEGRRDHALLDALDGALDHAPAQAVADVREGLNGDLSVHRRIRQIRSKVLRDGAGGSGVDPSRHAFARRLLGILRIVAADVLSEEPDTTGVHTSPSGRRSGAEQ